MNYQRCRRQTAAAKRKVWLWMALIFYTDCYKLYFRLSEVQFNCLLTRVGPSIREMQPHFRKRSG